MALIGVTGGETWPPVTSQGGPAVKNYDVEVNGVKTTLKLSDADARARGLLKPEPAQEKAKTPANKARTPANKGAAPKQQAAADK